jgi:hypothetical protein
MCFQKSTAMARLPRAATGDSRAVITRATASAGSEVGVRIDVHKVPHKIVESSTSILRARVGNVRLKAVIGRGAGHGPDLHKCALASLHLASDSTARRYIAQQALASNPSPLLSLPSPILPYHLPLIH